MAIKPAYVKKTARLLMERYPEAFSEDFERNKELVAELTNIESKSVRNRVAGYVTHKQAGQVADA
jgi:small subunit ribosomal protein S17e